MPVKLAPETLKTLCDTFKVGDRTAQYYGDFYEDKVLPRIQKEYLAHLIIAVEEMIDEKLRKDGKVKPQENNTDEGIGHEFTIVLLSIKKNPHGFPPGKSGAEAMIYRKCAVIYYEPLDDTKIENTKKLRILIAHELGHLLKHYKIIGGTEEIEGHANTFAYFAISGKNKFYRKKTKKLIYRKETEIINNIQKICPVKESWQVNHGPIKAEPS